MSLRPKGPLSPPKRGNGGLGSSYAVSNASSKGDLPLVFTQAGRAGEEKGLTNPTLVTVYEASSRLTWRAI